MERPIDTGGGQAKRSPRIERMARRERAMMVPRQSPEEPGLVTVDATWGAITPIELAPGVRTVGELEVLERIENNGPIVDTRLAHFYRAGTIPGALNLPHDRIEAELARLDRETATVFFCNGPQCAATPDAIRTLLTLGFPAGSILFYRGGIHDWMTLGLPIEPPS